MARGVSINGNDRDQGIAEGSHQGGRVSERPQTQERVQLPLGPKREGGPGSVRCW